MLRGEITSYIEDGECYLPNIFDAYHSHSVLFDFVEENNRAVKIT